MGSKLSESKHREIDMTSPNAPSESFTAASSNSRDDLRAKTEDAMSKMGDMAKQATDEAKRSAATLASEANDKVKTLLGQQKGAGADLVGHVAASARVAADDLDRNAPQLAGLIRDASRSMERFSQDIRGQSVDQLVRKASDFTRERPAVTFGAAAACGFFLFRLFKAGSARTSRLTGLVSDHAHHDAHGHGRYHPDSPPISPHYGQSHGA
jgi:ElaB/YqjD/DUF883 family membrane-anchored ribosome-binding protein